MALFYSLSLTVLPQVFWRQQNIRRTHCGLVLFLFINCSSTGVLETVEHQEDPLWPCSIPCH